MDATVIGILAATITSIITALIALKRIPSENEQQRRSSTNFLVEGAEGLVGLYRQDVATLRDEIRLLRSELAVSNAALLVSERRTGVIEDGSDSNT